MDLLGPAQLASIRTLDEFQPLAEAYLSPLAYAYVIGGAGSEITVAENRAAFNRIRLLPRILVDVSRIDTTLKLFDRDYAFPILLSPTGYHKLMHPEGEIETVQGANRAEATMIAALFSGVSIEAISARSERPVWIQVYLQNDRTFMKEFMERILAAGCEAVCMTVDEPVIGPRDREHRAGFKLPPGVERANLANLGSSIAAGAHRPSGRSIYSATHGSNVTWKEVEWLRSILPVRLLLKGILRAEDAERAMNAGCDGIIVSNHGGRSLDTVPATIDMLPEIAERIGGRIPVLLDGGIRRGIDVFKALALGATAVLIGRPYLYGLAVGGASGVARVVEILRTELEMTMGLTGCPALSSISRELLLMTR